MATARWSPIGWAMVLCCAAVGCESHRAAMTYDFESLNFGPLVGQDGWKDSPGAPWSGPGLIAMGTANEVTPPDGPNNTKVLMATAGAGRINDEKWGYVVRKSDRAWEVQVDYKREGPYISLGFDEDEDGKISASESVGWIAFAAGLGIQSQEKPLGGPQYVYSDPYPNLKGNFEGNAATWLRMKLVFDWTNKSDGACGWMSAWVKNLQRNTEWEQVMWPGGKSAVAIKRPAWAKWLERASAHPDRAGVILCPHHNRVYYQMDNLRIGVAPEQ